MRIRDLGNRPAPAAIRDLLSRALRGRTPIVRVERREVAYWQERSWTRQGNAYKGNYQTPHASFFGHVIDQRSGHIDFYLYNPSEEIRSHSHWTCFQHQGNGWYLIHMSKQPKDVSSGILSIERLIVEAYEI